MQGDDDNAARRWMLAQALGEEAAALAALGRPDDAAAAAGRALRVWQESVPTGRQPPGMFSSVVAQAQQLAGP